MTASLLFKYSNSAKRSPRPEGGGDFAPAVVLKARLRRDGGGSGAKRAFSPRGLETCGASE
jgi:hypothetical protein